MKLVPRLCSPIPIPRRGASRIWRLQTQFDRGPRHRPHNRTIPSLYPHQRPESRQIHRHDAVRHRRHRNRHGARHPRANGSGSLCYAPILSTEVKKMAKVDADLLSLSGLISGIASRRS